MSLKESGHFLGATAILIGTIIGAGIFGIPYVMAKLGFFPSVLYMLVIAAVILIVYLCYGEIILRTKQDCQMSGYADKYLGGFGKWLMVITWIFGLNGTLLVYIIGMGKFLTILFGTPGITEFRYGVIFITLANIILIFGLKIVEKLELLMVGFIVLVVIIYFVTGVGAIELNNLATIDMSQMFLPFGVFLFSFTGASAIVTMKRALGKKLSHLKKSIIWGTALPTVVYIIFALTVVGISGATTSEEAISGLEGSMGGWVIALGAVLGVLTVTTSYFTIGLALKEMYMFDLGLGKWQSWVLVSFLPLILVLVNVFDFVQVIDLVGGVMGAIVGVLILLIHRKAKKTGDQEPFYKIKLRAPVYVLLMLVFIVGVVYQMYYLLR